jgi:two-component sensor histidine kinase
MVKVSKLLWICSILWGFAGPDLWGQAGYVDSLLEVAHSQESLKHRFEAYGRLVSYYRHRQPDTAFLYARQQLAIGQEIGIPAELGIAYSDMAKTHYLLNQHDSSLIYAEKAYEQLSQTTDWSNQADVLTDWGSSLMLLGRMDEAKPRLDQALKVARQSGREKRIRFAHYQLGQWMMMQVKNDSAIWHLRQAQRLGKEASPSSQAEIRFTLGMIYMSQAMVDSAIASLKGSLALLDTLPMPGDRCLYNLNLALIYNMIGYPIAALAYAKAARKDAEAIQNEVLLGMVEYAFAHTFLLLRQPSKAITYAERALNTGEDQMISTNLSLLYLILAQAHFLNQNQEQGNHFLQKASNSYLAIQDKAGMYEADLIKAQIALLVDKSPEKARDILQQVAQKYPLDTPGFELNNLLRQSLEIKTWFQLGEWSALNQKIRASLADSTFSQVQYIYLDILPVYAALLAQKGNKAEAIAQLDRYRNLRDSLFQGQAAEQANRLETEFRTQIITDSLVLARQEKVIADKEKALVKQRWQTIALGVGLVGLALLALVFVFYQARRRARRDATYIESLNQEVHHRVKNNLQMLSNLINLQAARQQDPQTRAALSSTKSRIEAISALHRLLYQDREVSSLRMTEYILPLVEQMRQASGLGPEQVRIETHVAPLQVDIDRALPLAIILNEWLTNALKYAVPETEVPHLFIELKALGDERLMVVFADNGPGYDPGQRREGSYGTDLVSAMVLQINGDLQTDFTQGTRYNLTFRNPQRL